MDASVLRDTEERFRSGPAAARATPTVTAEPRRVWEERCPIYLAITRPNDVGLRLTVAEPATT
jgi:hypothetical protein